MISGHVLNFIKSPHQKTQELLPWLVNGTLEPEEAAAVEHHLQECAHCREELDSLRVLQAAYAGSEAEPDAERALARLRPRLDTEQAAPAPVLATSGWPQLSMRGPSPGWLRLALATQLGVIFALGWAVLQPDRQAFEYRTLSAKGAPAHAAGSLIVVFDAHAQQQQVAQVLRRSGARIVDGPTASGGYVLAVDHPALAQALTALRSDPAVVLAEPLVTEGSR